MTQNQIAELLAHLSKMTDLAVSSGVAALSAEVDNLNNTLWMTMAHDGDDQAKVNRTFQKMEGMKKSANAVVSVLKRPAIRDV
jgi:hypothetical protein